jgi:hypothetical protein
MVTELKTPITESTKPIPTPNLRKPQIETMFKYSMPKYNQRFYGNYKMEKFGRVVNKILLFVNMTRKII